MRIRSVLPALCLLAAPLAAQEAVLLRLNPPQGQVTRYHMTMETFMTGGPMAMMGGDPNQPMSRVTTVSTQTVTSVRADTITITQVVDSAGFEMPALPQAAAMAGGVAAQMRGMTTVQKMDRRGRIFDVETSGGPMAGMGGGPGGARRGMGGPGGGQSGNRNVLFLLPERPVRAGDSWSDSMAVEGDGGQPGMTMRATFRLERVAGRVATISMNGTMDMPMQGEVTSMNVTGEFQLDTGRSALNGMNMTMSGTMRGQGGEIPVRMQMTMRAL